MLSFASTSVPVIRVTKILHAQLSARPGIVALSLCVASGVILASGLFPQPTPSAIQYQQSQDWFWCANQAMGFLVPLVFLFSGLVGKLADRCRRLSGNRWLLTIALFAIAYGSADFLLNLPLACCEGYTNEHRFGLGTGSVGQGATRRVAGTGRYCVALGLDSVLFHESNATPVVALERCRVRPCACRHIFRVAHLDSAA